MLLHQKKKRKPDPLTLQAGERDRTKLYFLGFIIAVSATVRLLHINWELPELYEEAYPFQIAWKFWNWGSPGFDFNPQIFNYAGFSFYFHFLVQALHYFAGHLFGMYANLEAFQQAYLLNPTPFLLIARCVSVIFDLATILVSYRLARMLFDSTVAAAASCFLAINLLHLSQAHFINVDTPLTFFVMLTIYSIYRFRESPSMKWYTISGISMGLAIATKYTAVILIPFLVLCHIVKRGSTGIHLRDLSSRKLWQAIAAGVGVFFIFNPFIILSFREFLDHVSFIQYNVIEHGHLGIDSSQSSLRFYLGDSFPRQLGIALAIILPISLTLLIVRKQKEEFLLCLVPLVYLGVISGWAYRADRYLLPIMPVLVIAAAFGVVLIARKVSGLLSGRGLPAPRFGLTVLFVICCTIPGIVDTLRYHQSFQLPDTRTELKAWMGKHVPRKSVIAAAPVAALLSQQHSFILNLPFHPVMPEGTAPFYDTRWYEDFDFFIASSFDHERYALEPARFSRFIRFYSEVRKDWTVLHTFTPATNQNGPEISVYRPVGNTRRGIEEGIIQEVSSLAGEASLVEYLEKLAYGLLQKGSFQKSETALELALSFDGNNPRLLSELSEVQFKAGHFNRAMKTSGDLLAQDPSQADIIAFQGRIHERLGNGEAAEKNYLRALSLQPRMESVYKDLEAFYAERNVPEKLSAILKKHLAILPANGSRAVQIRERLHEIERSVQLSNQGIASTRQENKKR